jgi:molybdenum cofactor cytidylyltransferase
MVKTETNEDIVALVLAAGMSRRMGKPKMVLSWRDTTVIGQVVQTLLNAGISNIFIITGGDEENTVNSLKNFQVRFLSNPKFENGEMIDSVRVGLMNLPNHIKAALIVLGDQPQIECETIKSIITAYRELNSKIIVPSFQMKRGHPWLVDRKHWDDIVNLESKKNLRDFFSNHSTSILYVNLTNPTILYDLDTPEDYEQQNLE